MNEIAFPPDQTLEKGVDKWINLITLFITERRFTCSAELVSRQGSENSNWCLIMGWLIVLSDRGLINIDMNYSDHMYIFDRSLWAVSVLRRVKSSFYKWQRAETINRLETC